MGVAERCFKERPLAQHCFVECSVHFHLGVDMDIMRLCSDHCQPRIDTRFAQDVHRLKCNWTALSKPVAPVCQKSRGFAAVIAWQLWHLLQHMHTSKLCLKYRQTRRQPRTQHSRVVAFAIAFKCDGVLGV